MSRCLSTTAPAGAQDASGSHQGPSVFWQTLAVPSTLGISGIGHRFAPTRTENVSLKIGLTDSTGGSHRSGKTQASLSGIRPRSMENWVSKGAMDEATRRQLPQTCMGGPSLVGPGSTGASA